MPGFTDSREEFNIFSRLVQCAKVDMVQLRNLNIDPVYYFSSIGFSPAKDEPLGMREILRRLKIRFPGLILGYFNPSKRRIRKAVSK